MQCVEDKKRLLTELDNSKRGPDVIWYEKMRRFWGGVAYCSFYGLAEIIKFWSWVFSVKILRSSRDPDL
jgi:hypothetical protein